MPDSGRRVVRSRGKACAALSCSATPEDNSDILDSALISHSGRAGFQMPGREDLGSYANG
jgi:hypothetical protein